MWVCCYKGYHAAADGDRSEPRDYGSGGAFERFDPGVGLFSDFDSSVTIDAFM